MSTFQSKNEILMQNDAHGKALSLNLDPSTYGTFAEIGAGQEVARMFLNVGAASGTVAKTISAYDKKVSDDIYGAGTRYVSKERLLAMLDHEFGLLLDRLNATRGNESRFFAFADTVATRNYQGTNQQHGWVGVRFQAEPGHAPSEMLLHVNLRDSTAQLQQQALGILGVNLIFAAFHQRPGSDTFLAGLFDELSIARIEVDVIEFRGPAFANQDARAWCLALLNRQMANAIVFDTQGRIAEPSSALRKRPLLVMRGSLSHPQLFNPRLFQAAKEQFLAEGIETASAPVEVIEMTIRHVSRNEQMPVSEMLAAIDTLTTRGLVMVSAFPETYLLSRYFRQYSVEPIRFIMDVASAAKILHEVFYQALPGTLLEGIGRLLATNVTLYVASMKQDVFWNAVGNVSGISVPKATGDGVVTLDSIVPAMPLSHLFEYLRASGRMVALQSYP